MRSLRSLALSALLFATTATSALAFDPTIATHVSPLGSEQVRDDGNGYARPTLPGSERIQDDGNGYARPALAGSEQVQDDGNGYTSPAAPTQPASVDYERWL